MKQLFKIYFLCAFAQFAMFSSCKKLTEVKLPRNLVGTETVFNSDLTATAAMLNIYSDMRTGSFNDGLSSISELAGLSADELTNHNIDLEKIQFEQNALLSDNGNLFNTWVNAYNIIYQANRIIEGLTTSTNISASIKSQLLGEAKLIRAYSHFYLVNLFGDIPLVITSDYTVNVKVKRSAAADVYQQIIADLTDAESMLSADYITTERVRPNKYAATALLARVYLYREDWSKAEQKASSVISTDSVYFLPALSDVFLANSAEAIWQIIPSLSAAGEGFPPEAQFYDPASAGNWSGLTESLYNSFEAGDERANTWAGTNGTYFFPTKYKQYSYGPITEYSTVLRLAELYLIRAEAKIKQGNIEGGVEDLNTIRDRARANATVALPNPLPALSTSLTESAALDAVEAERRHELFTEWGHRWLDLKRWKKATTVLSPSKADWNITDELYPLPVSELQKNPNLAPQNLGY